MPSRYDRVADFYRRNHLELLRVVGHAIWGPDALVEDACAHAWAQLLNNPQVALDRHGFAWLYVVALREAYRLSHRARREVTVGSPDRLAESWTDDASALAERVTDRISRREFLAGLPARTRVMVVLQGAGFSYQEIARLCGTTLRTVERQLLRGKRSLRTLDRQAASHSA